ncbi:hypothetical protein STEG23_027445, partial [Scotinomys teguina]
SICQSHKNLSYVRTLHTVSIAPAVDKGLKRKAKIMLTDTCGRYHVTAETALWFAVS